MSLKPDTEFESRYIVISSDCHAGANLDSYRWYLPSPLYEEFDAWRGAFQSPWDDLRDDQSREYQRNFDNPIRQADLECDGIVGEVLYPNTVPPFAPKAGLHGADPDPVSPRDFELRWAGIHAHNEWLVDFCAALPGRRAGVAQVLIEDVQRAVDEVRWVAAKGLFGGILIPNPSPNRSLPPLNSPDYEPIWTECEALGLPVHTHGGGGIPDYGPYPSSPLMMYLEFGWYAHRPLVRLLGSGVFERHPSLTFVMTEASWMPEVLTQMDFMVRSILKAPEGSVQRRFGEEAGGLSMLPSEYWKRQCFLGASFMNRSISKQRHNIGLSTVMWGSDYPHSEGTHPYTKQALRYVFSDVPEDEVSAVLGLNALRAFRFDRDAVQGAATRHGPTVSEIATPLLDHQRPEGVRSMAFERG